MTILSQNRNTGITAWKRLSQWLQAFGEALDFDPLDQVADAFNRKVSELEKTVSDLNRKVSELENTVNCSKVE